MLPSIFETCIPREEILAGELSVDLFAAKLRLVVEKKATVDEIARYLRAAKAKQINNSDLAQQVVAFLFSLMDLAGACNNLVFVYSLASAFDTFAEEITELQELIRASARQERVLSPSTDVEVYNIVKQRLFKSVSAEAAEKAASEYFTTNSWTRS